MFCSILFDCRFIDIYLHLETRLLDKECLFLQNVHRNILSNLYCAYLFAPHKHRITFFFSIEILLVTWNQSYSSSFTTALSNCMFTPITHSHILQYNISIHSYNYTSHIYPHTYTPTSTFTHTLPHIPTHSHIYLRSHIYLHSHIYTHTYTFLIYTLTHTFQLAFATVLLKGRGTSTVPPIMEHSSGHQKYCVSREDG